MIFAFTDGHPMRTMQLADACWLATPKGGAVATDTFGGVLEALRAREDDPLERIFTRDTDTEKAVLGSVSISGTLFGTRRNCWSSGAGRQRPAAGCSIPVIS